MIGELSLELWVSVLAPPLTGGVTWGPALYVSEPPSLDTEELLKCRAVER